MTAKFDNSQFRKAVNQTRLVYHSWRYGQTVFNVMHMMHPEIADLYRGTVLDPFYHDDKVEQFITACAERIDNG